MPETLEDLIMRQPPTADRPLLGTIVLVVEDSRHACEALRLICQRSRARIRRAESLASARRHLRTYRPRIAVIDLGLPDGSGLELIETLNRAEPRIDGIIAISGDDSREREALKTGADTFLAKPISSISAFQDVVLDLLPEDLQPEDIARPTTDGVSPDPMALHDDLCLAADLLRSGPNRESIKYIAAFLASLAKDTGDRALAQLAGTVERVPGETQAAALADKVQNHIVPPLPV